MTTAAEKDFTTRLDIRPVEPKHRYDRIMKAYYGLQPEETLDLLVDHDPSCMYYTLRAEEGAESFTFDYLERGPKRWRVLVTRH